MRTVKEWLAKRRLYTTTPPEREMGENMRSVESSLTLDQDLLQRLRPTSGRLDRGARRHRGRR